MSHDPLRRRQHRHVIDFVGCAAEGSRRSFSAVGPDMRLKKW